MERVFITFVLADNYFEFSVLFLSKNQKENVKIHYVKAIVVIGLR